MTLAMVGDEDSAFRQNPPVVSRVGRSAGSNEQAVEEAYATYYRDVFRYVISLTGSVPEAEDIAADVFERALRTWRVTPEATLAWLLLVARRIATDRWRRARRSIGLLARARAQADPPTTEFWRWFEEISRVLTARQREALALRYQRDLSDQEIATIMGLSQSGVRSLVARAIERLRAHPELL